MVITRSLALLIAAAVFKLSFISSVPTASGLLDIVDWISGPGRHLSRMYRSVVLCAEVLISVARYFVGTTS